MSHGWCRDSFILINKDINFLFSENRIMFHLFHHSSKEARVSRGWGLFSCFLLFLDIQRAEQNPGAVLSQGQGTACPGTWHCWGHWGHLWGHWVQTPTLHPLVPFPTKSSSSTVGWVTALASGQDAWVIRCFLGKSRTLHGTHLFPNTLVYSLSTSIKITHLLKRKPADFDCSWKIKTSLVDESDFVFLSQKNKTPKKPNPHFLEVGSAEDRLDRLSSICSRREGRMP